MAKDTGLKGVWGPKPAQAKPAAPAPKRHPYSLAGLKRTPAGFVVVVARFDESDELQLLTEHGPPESLREYATSRLLKRLKGLR